MLRQRAAERAEKANATAQRDAEYGEADRALKKGEIELARAEAFSPQDLPSLIQKMNAYRTQRKQALLRLGIREEELSPRYQCDKCSDTGFLPNGKACDCYPNL